MKLEEIIVLEASEALKFTPLNFNTEKWLREKAKHTVKILLNSKYPKDSFRIEFKTKWLKKDPAISVYFRIPDLYPTDTEENI